MEDDTQNFLESAESVGKVESRGSISIDPGKAMDKLGLYQLSEPYLFILKLVQWAVASRASLCHFHLKSNTLIMEHDAPTPTLEVLRGLLLFQNLSPALRHLATALLAVRHLASGAVSITSRGKDQDVCYTIHGDGSLSVEARPPCRHHQTTLAIPLAPPSDRLKQWWQTLSGSNPIRRFLRLCKYAGLPLLWNDDPVTAYVFGNNPSILKSSGINVSFYLEMDGCMHLLGNDSAPDQLAGLSGPTGQKFIWMRGDLSKPGPWDVAYQSSGFHFRVQAVVPHAFPLAGITANGNPVCACQALAQRTPRRPGALTVVYDGVAVEYPQVEQIPKGLKIFMSGRGLTTDLSGLRIVDDESWRMRYGRLVEWIGTANVLLG